MRFRSYLFIPFLVVSVFSSCPSSNTWKTKCYVFQTEKMEFSKAETVCIKKGGHLASIPDFFVNNVIGQAGKFAFQSVTDFWIGASKKTSWEWTDGSNFPNFTDWARGEPSRNGTEQNCAFMSYFNWDWKTENCSNLKPFVCGIPIQSFKTSRIRSARNR
uniref:C-type lectin domain-containing protein n=1 Tax=Panagrolaimus superbus TaxID=310955 RepID=A0A914YJR6_9BILA